MMKANGGSSINYSRKECEKTKTTGFIMIVVLGIVNR